MKIIFAVAGILMIFALVYENMKRVQKSPSSVFAEIGSPLYKPFDIEKECLKLQEELEKQDPYIITLWWGFDGLRLNEDGSTEWISRRKPDTSLQSIVQNAHEAQMRSLQIKQLEKQLKETKDHIRLSRLPEDVFDSFALESGIITKSKQDESDSQSTIEIIYGNHTRFVKVEDAETILKEFEGKRIEPFYIDSGVDIDNQPKVCIELKKIGGYYIYDNETDREDAPQKQGTELRNERNDGFNVQRMQDSIEKQINNARLRLEESGYTDFTASHELTILYRMQLNLRNMNAMQSKSGHASIEALVQAQTQNAAAVQDAILQNAVNAQCQNSITPTYQMCSPPFLAQQSPYLAYSPGGYCGTYRY